MPLTHKFAKGSWFEIFRNEGMWSTPLDPKLMFWSVSDRFVTARMSMQTGQTGTINAKFAKQGRVRICRNGCTQSIPLDTKLMFWGVSDHFDTVLKSTQNQTNWCHYRTSSLNKVASEFLGTNAPDPLNCTQNSCFGVFRTVSLLHESRYKTGRTRAIIAQVQ
jgi:hypothetical protein